MRIRRVMPDELLGVWPETRLRANLVVRNALLEDLVDELPGRVRRLSKVNPGAWRPRLSTLLSESRGDRG